MAGLGPMAIPTIDPPLQPTPPLATFPPRIIFRTGGRGGLHRPPFLFLDLDAPHHTGLEARIADAVAPTLADLGFELVRVAVLGRDRPTVQIMADRAGGAPITVADCETISRALGAVLDVADLISTAWSLEVSSAGIDRPLTRRRDWNRFAGHRARAELEAPLDGRKRLTGIVLGADETHARLRLDEGTEIAFPLTDIRRAKLVLTDELIAAVQPPTRTN